MFNRETWETLVKSKQESTTSTITSLVSVWLAYFLPTYFTIQLIFSIIHEFHCTFWYYSWISLYYFNQHLPLFTVLSAKNFQFLQNKRISNRPLVT